MEYRKGIWFGVAAYVMWGLTPLFWNLVDTGATLVVLHRIVWSTAILAIIITARRGWREFVASYATGRVRAISLIAGLALATNWGLFVWSVTSGHIVDASLGYYINPLVSVFLGVVFLRERLTRMQWTAVAIATIGVSTMGLLSGVAPLLPLSMAFSFGTYGLLKKIDISPAPLVSLFGEVLALAAPAAIALALLNTQQAPSLGASWNETLFFVSAGMVTIIPLLWFGAAAKRIPLSMVGFLQYLAPTIQLAIGLTVFHEALTLPDAIGFATVWVALVLFTVGRPRNGIETEMDGVETAATKR